MTPAAALEMVRAKRHQVRLAPVRFCPRKRLERVGWQRVTGSATTIQTG